jgi:hypothetical protein
LKLQLPPEISPIPNSPDLAILFTLPQGQICERKIAKHQHKFLTMKLTILNIYCALLVIAGLSVSCKKNISADIQETGAEALSGIGPVPPYTWTELPVTDNQTYPGDNPEIQIFTTKIGSNWWAFTGDCTEKAYKLNNSTRRWELQPEYDPDFCLFNDYKRYFFSYGSKMYYGYDGSEYAFKTFDPVTGVKTSLANLPVAWSSGFARFFVIGDNAYLFLEGHEDVFYRYNILGNTWTNMGSSPFGKRRGATIVVMGDQLYIGLGWESTTYGGQTFRSYKRDWKVVTIGSTYGAVKAFFPGDLRDRAQHFVIGDNIYVGLGYHYSPGNDPTTTSYRDFWKYNTNNNAWTRQPDFPGTLEGGKVSQYGNRSAFAIGNTGYLVTGGLNEFWKFSNQPLIVTQQ